MNPTYKNKLDTIQCWKSCSKKCPLGQEFLKELYSWSDINPLHPNLAWRVCEPCEETGKPPTDWTQFT